jgi:hypothetical protein
MKELFIVNSKEPTLVDDDVYHLYNKYKWYLTNGYVCYGEKDASFKSYERLHRIILGAKEGEFIDHIDRNKLNNQRNNLRIVTQQQNCHNRGKIKNTKNKYKGVSFLKNICLYQSRCRMMGQDFFLGYFKTEIASAYAYNKKAIELSKFSSINYLPFSIEELEKLLITDRNDRAVAKSKYKNIYFKKKSGRMKCDKWYISFFVNKIRTRKGYFDTEEEALSYLEKNYPQIS